MEANGLRGAMEEEAEVIRTLSRVEPLSITAGAPEGSEQTRGVTLVVNPLVVRLPLEGVVDLAAEQDRLRGNWPAASRNWSARKSWSTTPTSAPRPAPTWWKPRKTACATSRNSSSALAKSWPSLGGS